MRTYTLEDLDWIRSNLHLTDRAIGKHFGVSGTAIYGVRVRHGIERPSRLLPIRSLSSEQISSIRSASESTRELAILHGVKQSVIESYRNPTQP